MVRTTLTIEDDLARQLEALRVGRGQSFKQVVNEVLGLGLRELRRGAGVRQELYRTESVSLGGSRLPDVDNVAEALAIAEGDPFR